MRGDSSLGEVYFVYILVGPDEEKKPFFVGVLTQISEDIRGIEVDDRILSDIRKQLSQGLEDFDDRQRSLYRQYFESTGEAHVIDAINQLFLVVARNLAFEHAELVRNLILHSSYPTTTFGYLRASNPECLRSYDEVFGAAHEVPGLDFPADPNGQLKNTYFGNCGGYYVYALMDPNKNEIFYVGKGVGRRVWDHFRDAQTFSVEQMKKKKGDKLERLKVLLDRGATPSKIVKILARVPYDDAARLTETFFMKFIIGARDLENSTSGKYADRIRAKDDLKRRYGFDRICKRGQDGRFPRQVEEDLFKGAGLERYLSEVCEAFIKNLTNKSFGPIPRFSSAKIGGAGELVQDAEFETTFGKVLLRLQMRSPWTLSIHCLIQPGGNDKRARGPARERARSLIKSAYGAKSPPGLRKDDVFNCNSWKKEKIATDADEAIRRATILYKVVTEKTLTKDERHEIFR